MGEIAVEQQFLCLGITDATAELPGHAFFHVDI